MALTEEEFQAELRAKDRKARENLWGVAALVALPFAAVGVQCVTEYAGIETANLRKIGVPVLVLSLALHAALAWLLLSPSCQMLPALRIVLGAVALVMVPLLCSGIINYSCAKLDFNRSVQAVHRGVVVRTIRTPQSYYITSILDEDGTRQLVTFKQTPGGGGRIVFAARTGLLGVLYDIEYISGIQVGM